MNLVAPFRSRTVPQYGCEHHPERAFAPVLAVKPTTLPGMTHRAA